MFLALNSADLIKYADLGLELKRKHSMLSDSPTTANALIAAGMAETLYKSGMDACDSLDEATKKKLSQWISVVVKASEYQEPFTIVGTSTHVYAKPKKGQKRDVIVTNGATHLCVASLDGEGNEAKFEIHLGEGAGPVLYLHGTQIIEYAKAEVNSHHLFKMYIPNLVLLAAISIRAKELSS